MVTVHLGGGTGLLPPTRLVRIQRGQLVTSGGTPVKGERTTPELLCGGGPTVGLHLVTVAGAGSSPVCRASVKKEINNGSHT